MKKSLLIIALLAPFLVFSQVRVTVCNFTSKEVSYWVDTVPQLENTDRSLVLLKLTAPKFLYVKLNEKNSCKIKIGDKNQKQEYYELTDPNNNLKIVYRDKALTCENTMAQVYKDKIIVPIIDSSTLVQTCALKKTEYRDVLKSLAVLPNDKARLVYVAQRLKTNCLTIDEIGEMIKLFKEEGSKYSFATSIFKNCTNPEKYLLLKNIFVDAKIYNNFLLWGKKNNLKEIYF
jgi:hypothetical protein